MVVSQVGGTYKTRVVTNSQLLNDECSHWKGDYYKFKALTYAQVLKQTSNNSNSNKSNLPSNPHSKSTHVPTCTQSLSKHQMQGKSLIKGQHTVQMIQTAGSRQRQVSIPEQV